MPSAHKFLFVCAPVFLPSALPFFRPLHSRNEEKLLRVAVLKRGCRTVDTAPPHASFSFSSLALSFLSSALPFFRPLHSRDEEKLLRVAVLKRGCRTVDTAPPHVPFSFSSLALSFSAPALPFFRPLHSRDEEKSFRLCVCSAGAVRRYCPAQKRASWAILTVRILTFYRAECYALYKVLL